MINEAKHPTEVVGYEGRLDELAKTLGNLDYRTLRTLLDKLGDNILAQSHIEERNGRENLSDRLDFACRKLYQTVEAIDRVCRICEPYMKKDSE